MTEWILMLNLKSLEERCCPVFTHTSVVDLHWNKPSHDLFRGRFVMIVIMICVFKVLVVLAGKKGF